jgi:hypothetical protein
VREALEIRLTECVYVCVSRLADKE